MTLLAVIMGIGIWLLLATLVVAVAVSARRGDLTTWLPESEDEGVRTTASFRDAA